MSASNLQAYVNGSSSDSDFINGCYNQAVALVEHYIGENDIVPELVVERAVLEVGSELFHRRQAPNGVMSFAGLDGANAVRVARDPMVGAYPLLQPYMGLGIA